MTRSSGDRAFDEQLLVETREEIRKGWARGPFKLEELEKDAVVSRRFLLQQGSKARVIDDYSVSGINDTCAAHNKVDLRMTRWRPWQTNISGTVRRDSLTVPWLPRRMI